MLPNDRDGLAGLVNDMGNTDYMIENLIYCSSFNFLLSVFHQQESREILNVSKSIPESQVTLKFSTGFHVGSNRKNALAEEDQRQQGGGEGEFRSKEYPIIVIRIVYSESLYIDGQ